MNLADFLDRPIAFQRCFVGLGVGVTGALMLSQAVYWAKRAEDASGWFYKSQVEWEAETGLTRTEQENARKRLLALGALQEDRRGIPAKLFYRVDFDALERALRKAKKARKQDCGKPAIKSAENLQTGEQESGTPDCGKPANRAAGNLQSKQRKTTTETTADISSRAGADAPAEPPKTGKGAALETEETALQAACKHTWVAYCLAFEQRYGVMPVRNQVVNANVKTLVKRLGYEEAPQVAAWYVANVNEAFVVKNSHGMGILANQSESFRTQWARGQAVTATQARQADQTASNLNAIDEAKRMLGLAEGQGGAHA